MTSLREEIARLVVPSAWAALDRRMRINPQWSKEECLVSTIATCGPSLSKADAILQLITTRLTSEEAVTAGARAIFAIRETGTPLLAEKDMVRTGIQAAIGRATHEQ